MLILSIDSAAGACSACLWQDGHTLSQISEAMERGQDQRLMPLILDVMQKAGKEFSQLDRIAVTRGPGSFTGLRIGLAAARGIGLAANRPVIGIDRFDLFREQTKTNAPTFIVLESRRDELFCCHYASQNAAPKMMSMTENEIATFLKKNPGTVLVRDKDSNGDQDVVTSALLASRADKEDPKFLPRPLYIRPPDVTIKTPTQSDRSQCV